MNIRHWALTLRPFLVLLSLCMYGSAIAADQSPQSDLQATMREVFQALTQALPWSLDEQQFQAPANRQRIHAALRTLAGNTAGLAAHGQSVPQSFDFLRHSLARNAQDAALRYEQGEYRSARFLLQHLTDNCFACHSRFSSPQQFDLGKRFLEETHIERLPLRDQVRLQVATRQFGTALATCEALFGSSAVAAADVDLTGLFEDYLKIVMRIDGDFPRAIATLEQFLHRPDVPPDLRERLTSWVGALKELQPQGIMGEALPRARALIESGQHRNRFPADYQGLIHFVVASSLLHRYVDARPSTTDQLAEAYYLLGIAESYISRTSWISETPFFLETAIRLSPKSPIAAKAYDVLNGYILAEYTGSSGRDLAQDIQEYLEELRRLRGGS